VDVHIGGAIFTMSPADFFTSLDDHDDSCVIEVQPSPDGMNPILGDSFLRTVLAVFDIERTRIGLARRPGRAVPYVPGAYSSFEQAPPLAPEVPIWQQPRVLGSLSVFFGVCAIVLLILDQRDQQRALAQQQFLDSEIAVAAAVYEELPP